LTMIRKKPRVGIKALLDLIRMPREEINTTKIVFSIGPRINAAGRMGDATTAVQLMIAENEAKGKAFAHELESVNMRRRDKDSKTMEEALSMIDDGVDLSETSIMVLLFQL
ncbi:MAG TPA: single-stranded-DNA-specific exonuclease RecJ, partial [Balneola sp.]|nr:single-stranded-DNA-specific exonuclease RecJ [Balneola sp.]